MNVQIDFDGIGRRIVALGGVPERQYSDLHAGAAGTVFQLNLSNLQFTTIRSFTALADNGTNTDGAFPVAVVLRVGGSLYGTTFSGGSH